MAGIVITGAASGGQINPAVSVGMAACGRLPLNKLPAYLLGQYLGALLGALLVVLLYCGSGESTMAMASYPGLATWMLPQVVDQLICTCLLVLGITAVVDQGQQPAPLLVGLIVTVISLGLGLNAGAAMNPAVDFVPR